MSRAGECLTKNCGRSFHLTLEKSCLVVSFLLLVQLTSSVHLATGELTFFSFSSVLLDYWTYLLHTRLARGECLLRKMRFVTKKDFFFCVVPIKQRAVLGLWHMRQMMMDSKSNKISQKKTLAWVSTTHRPTLLTIFIFNDQSANVFHASAFSDRMFLYWWVWRFCMAVLKLKNIFYEYLHFTGKSADTASTTECPRLLGMSSGSIQDWQIASSSQWTGVGDLTEFASSSSSSSSSQGAGGGVGMYNNQGGSCQPKYARLYQSGNKAWCAKHRSVGEWILVDLGVISQVWRSLSSDFFVVSIR